jgi:hypothetical protein
VVHCRETSDSWIGVVSTVGQRIADETKAKVKDPMKQMESLRLCVKLSDARYRLSLRVNGANENG